MQPTILLVDDNKAFIDNIKDVLEEENCRVVTANSGEEACMLSERKSFDLVLMDIKMPGMDGVECFLRMKHKDPDVKVVLFTAYALEELIDKARRNGVLEVIRKPLDVERLIHLIHKATNRNIGGWVLIADDDRALCENLVDALTDAGFQVAAVSDGEEAIQEAKKKRYDILLLDMKMPGMNGLEVFREIKTVHPAVITILITGYADEMKSFIQQAVQENAYTMLPKPIEMNRLIRILHRVIEEKKTGVLRKPSLEL